MLHINRGNKMQSIKLKIESTEFFWEKCKCWNYFPKFSKFYIELANVFFWSPHLQTTPVTRLNRPGATCRLQACGTKRRGPCWPCCCSASLCSSPYSPSPAPQAALGKPHASWDPPGTLLLRFCFVFQYLSGPSLSLIKKSRLAVQWRNADRLFNQSTCGRSLGIGCWEEGGGVSDLIWVHWERVALLWVIRECVKKHSVRTEGF